MALLFSQSLDALLEKWHTAGFGLSWDEDHTRVYKGGLPRAGLTPNLAPRTPCNQRRWSRPQNGGANVTVLSRGAWTTFRGWTRRTKTLEQERRPWNDDVSKLSFQLTIFRETTEDTLVPPLCEQGWEMIRCILLLSRECTRSTLFLVVVHWSNTPGESAEATIDVQPRRRLNSEPRWFELRFFYQFWF